MKTNFCDTVYDEKDDKLHCCRQSEIAECNNCGKLFPKRKQKVVNGKALCPECFESVK